MEKKEEIERLRYEHYPFFLAVFFVFCIEATIAILIFFEDFGNIGFYLAGGMSSGLWGIWWYLLLIQNPRIKYAKVTPSSFSLRNRIIAVGLLILLAFAIIVLYIVKHPEVFLRKP